MVKLAMDLKNKRQVALVACLIGALLLYLYVNFLLLPQISDVAAVYDRANKIRSGVKAAERNVAEIESLKKQVALYRGKIDSYERILPAEQGISKLLEDLSEMAKSANVKIVGITPLSSKQEPRPDQIYQEIPILINAKAGYHELGRFLADLENSDRFMKIVDIKVMANKAAPKRHDIELMVLAYKLLPNR
jgi:Tfp pilus assembly protein PilO